MLQSNSSLLEDFKGFGEQWAYLKKKVKETNKKEDYEMYKFFLNEAKVNFSKAYLGAKNEKIAELIKNILKTVSCEIKENNIKYKEHLSKVKHGK